MDRAPGEGPSGHETGEPRTLGPYLVEAEIGRGGMGIVYQARRSDTDELVALKLMAPDLASNPRFRERFLIEAEVAPTIDHPNVVPVNASGEIGGELFIEMRLVDGVDLARLLKSEVRLDPPRALAMFRQAAAALDAAHEAGVVHRDVKPQNILVVPGKTDLVYLTDFGLVRPVGSDATVSRSGEIFGSVPYMAPELIENHPADGRADVYSLGCVLLECLTGSPPFADRSEIGVIWGHIHEEPPRPSDLSPDLPRGLDDVVIRSMAKHPDDRYLTCGEMVADMEVRAEKRISDLAYRKMRPLIERPKRAKTEREVWSSNFFPELSRVRAASSRISWTRVAAFMAAWVMVASVQFGRDGGIARAVTDVGRVAVSAGSSLVDAVLGDEVTSETPDRELTAARRRSVAGEGPAGGTDSAAAAARKTLGSQVQGDSPGTKDPAGSEGSPEIVAPPKTKIVFQMGNTQEADIYVANASGEVKRLTENDVFDGSPKWSPNRRMIAFLRLVAPTPGIFELWVMRRNGSQQQRVAFLGKGSVDIGWSPSGKRLIYSYNDTIYTVKLDGADSRLIYRGGRGPDWSPDGSKIVYRDADGEIWVMKPDGSERVRLLGDSVEVMAPSSLAWSPDGSQIAFTELGLEVYSGGESTRTNRIFVMNADGSNLRPITTATGESEAAWSPTGKEFVYTLQSDLYLMSADGSNRRRLTNLSVGEYYPHWRW